jgi:Tol biopolymer transport system component
MKMAVNIFRLLIGQIAVLALIALSCSVPVQEKSLDLKGPYLGQITPGAIPELFAPGVIATGFNERDLTISPDGNEIFYGLLTSRHITIMYTRLADGIWTDPEIAPFARNSSFFFLEPCFSPDGKTIYFLSTMPPAGKEPKPRWTYQNIWASDKHQDGSWGQPYNPDTVLNRLNSQFYPSLTKNGTIYFTRSDEKAGKSVILRARKNGTGFGEPELLPPVINGNRNIFNAFISPDESFLIGCVDNQNNTVNPGCVNYYLFFRDKNDNWSEGISFGPEINIKRSNAISSSVSPDGKYLFFSAQKTSEEMQTLSQSPKLGEMVKLLSSPQNGNNDIYWVSSSVIENLRNEKQTR